MTRPTKGAAPTLEQTSFRREVRNRIIANPNDFPAEWRRENVNIFGDRPDLSLDLAIQGIKKVYELLGHRAQPGERRTRLMKLRSGKDGLPVEMRQHFLAAMGHEVTEIGESTPDTVVDGPEGTKFELRFLGPLFDRGLVETTQVDQDGIVSSIAFDMLAMAQKPPTPS